MKIPNWCTTPGMKWYWTHPWLVPLHPLKARRFKWRCWRHGLLTPNFSRREAASKDGKGIPWRKRFAAQRQGFHMERVRHRIGDKSIRVLSWYRSPQHNRNVGGARRSQHIKARACDVDSGTIRRIGVHVWNKACEAIFRNGGIGTDIGKSPDEVRHVDSRRGPARWTYS